MPTVDWTKASKLVTSKLNSLCLMCGRIKYGQVIAKCLKCGGLCIHRSDADMGLMEKRGVHEKTAL